MKRAAATLVILAVLALGGQAAAAKKTPPPPSPPGTYTVAKGDNLSKIAKKFGTTVDAIVQANAIKKRNQIRIGAVLKLPPPPALARMPEKLRLSPERLALIPEFDKAAAKHKVPADLLKAVAWMESGWQNDKVSPVGAYGIGQLMPDTVAFVNQNLLKGAKLDPKKPIDNISMSARFLNYLLAANNGDVRAALASYYQGLASFRREGPKPVSVVYVDTILALRQKF
jgi:N-acetylmuramoyl-L-alanine amidase